MEQQPRRVISAVLPISLLAMLMGARSANSYCLDPSHTLFITPLAQTSRASGPYGERARDKKQAEEMPIAHQIESGVWKACDHLFIVGMGLLMYHLGKWLVEGFNEDAPPKGMPKWRAVIVSLIVAAVCAFLASQSSTVTEGSDMLYGGEVVDVIDTIEPYKTAASVVTFCCASMWYGIYKGERP